ncbi:ECF transporter S component [Paenibacillus pasadenensis]|uniref:ECF transporter S component n=1 Tax=Paenibacillus pasadenensis TaxID=217090 RepID=UPI00203EE8A0|nr:ECF transporter S component [Paenibacillus pasadenensis]MCM3750253.1 ECF transporter S component [Paenibacillus pasadenensis]
MWRRELYLPLSLLMVFLAMLPFFIRFERRRLRAEELLLIAMLGAIAAVSRIPFAPLPSVQPVSFVVIMAALVFGAETGFLVGAIAAIVSNLFLGQGPWTPWQMFSWGMIGFTAGLLRNTRFMGSLWGKNLFGLVWGFLFGWIMNLWGLLGFVETLNWQVVFASYAASFAFDLTHGLSNVFFLTLFSGIWLKILGRVKLKYGLLEH